MQKLPPTGLASLYSHRSTGYLQPQDPETAPLKRCVLGSNARFAQVSDARFARLI